ncbi:MAG: hypothetical protein K2L95_02430 [Alphaproteobacteria bacterium]|nr:hypothetical protein [Alphaproteobacteria bacterium]
MSQIIIDARYYGNIMRTTRKHLKMNIADAAALLQMKTADYKRCECGRALFNESVMQRLFHASFTMLMIRGAARKCPRK